MNESKMDEHTSFMDYDDWTGSLDDDEDDEDDECFSHVCDNCGHKTNDPVQATTITGTDADGNRGWEIDYLECPECGINY
jgi:hypothetical protein